MYLLCVLFVWKHFFRAYFTKDAIAFADSVGHEIIALNDGSYIMIDEGQTTLYGEAYMIKDREQTQICKEDEFVLLHGK